MSKYEIQMIVRHLTSQGFRVIIVSREPLKLEIVFPQ